MANLQKLKDMGFRVVENIGDHLRLAVPEAFQASHGLASEITVPRSMIPGGYGEVIQTGKPEASSLFKAGTEETLPKATTEAEQVAQQKAVMEKEGFKTDENNKPNWQKSADDLDKYRYMAGAAAIPTSISLTKQDDTSNDPYGFQKIAQAYKNLQTQAIDKTKAPVGQQVNMNPLPVAKEISDKYNQGRDYLVDKVVNRLNINPNAPKEDIERQKTLFGMAVDPLSYTPVGGELGALQMGLDTYKSPNQSEEITPNRFQKIKSLLKPEQKQKIADNNE